MELSALVKEMSLKEAPDPWGLTGEDWALIDRMKNGGWGAVSISVLGAWVSVQFVSATGERIRVNGGNTTWCLKAALKEAHRIHRERASGVSA